MIEMETSLTTYYSNYKVHEYNVSPPIHISYVNVSDVSLNELIKDSK